MAKILLTGATGGFGYLTVERLIREGHHVVGTARDLSGRNEPKAAEIRKIGAAMVEMDVTNDGSVNAGVDAAARALDGIDVVINNAGVGVLGWTEAFSAEDVRRVFDVNVFGVHRVIRATLPFLRKSKEPTIVAISSLLGRITVPFYGPYNATKWALEGLMENYRTELSQSGIEVCVVEPGGYPTTFIDHLVRPSDPVRTQAYGEAANMPEMFLKNFEETLAKHPAQDPKNVATAIHKLLSTEHGRRPFRTIVDVLGMGQAVEGYNDVLAQVTKAIYGNFGIGHLLEVRKP